MKHGYRSLKTLVLKTGHSKNTINKYLSNPSPERADRDWSTRQNPFEEVWGEIKEMLDINPGLEAKTIFEHLQQKYSDKFTQGQLRTLQRHVKIYKAQEGPSKEVMFEQEHFPGNLCASDFTHIKALSITIRGQPFDHLLYHFVLTYSNWEWVYICHGETFEALRSGLKKSLLQLGGVPKEHLSDNLTAAVQNLTPKGEFKVRYKELMNAFGMTARTTQPSSPNENGDVEQRNYRFKKAVSQALMLRGSRDFDSVEEYEKFLHKLLTKLNSSRAKLVEEEIACLKALPERLLADYTLRQVKVTKFSTVRINKCCYSVPSRLIGETVEAKVYEDKIEIMYGQKKILQFSRMRGNCKFSIDYRHIIESLRRKPGAFGHYRYQEGLFPSSIFRMAYDALKSSNPKSADKQYIEILYQAAMNGEESVERCLRKLLGIGEISLEGVQKMLGLGFNQSSKIEDITILAPDLKAYDDAFGLEANI